MDMETLRKNYKSQILEIAHICNAKDIRVFGSVARNEFGTNSDIDFLVQMKPNSGFGIGGLKWRLEELLNVKVDIVTEKSLHALIKNQVLREAIKL